MSSEEEVFLFKEEMAFLQKEQEGIRESICQSMNRYIQNYLQLKNNRIIASENPKETYGLYPLFTFNEPRFKVCTPLREETVPTKEEGGRIILRDCKQIYRFKSMMKKIRKEVMAAGLEEEKWEIKGSRLQMKMRFGTLLLGCDVSLKEENGQFLCNGKLAFPKSSKTMHVWVSLATATE